MAHVKGYSVAGILAHNEEPLTRLRRSLRLSQGQFSLVIARCNYARLRSYLLNALRAEILADQVLAPSVLQLSPDTTSLRAAIQQLVDAQMADQGLPTAVLVSGLETLLQLDQVLTAANQVRDSLRQTFPFPVVLWVNDQVLRQLNRYAPDFKTFAGTPILFEYPVGELLHSLHKEAHALFRRVLNQGSDRFLPNAAIDLEAGSPLRNELEFALNDLANQGQTPDPELQASLEFVQGRDAHANGQMETALELYQHSLQFWQQQVGKPQKASEPGKSLYQTWRSAHRSNATHSGTISPLERQGCVLFHIGLWWRSFAVLQRSTYRASCEQARHYFLESLAVFQEANRLDLVARYVPALAEVLQKLRAWEELEEVALASLELHHLYPDPVRQARDRGFLAEIALERQAWPQAVTEATQALALLDLASDLALPTLDSLDWLIGSQRGWYWFLLGEAQAQLGETEVAIAHLETARQTVDLRYDPILCLRILETLQRHYFQLGEYLNAFRAKQDLRRQENRLGLRAFVGAGQVQPWQPVDPVLPAVQAEKTVANAITASGREQDVRRLMERVERDDYKLTVLYGQSGVGKSSVLNAGLVPYLQQQKFLKARRILPIVLSNYVDWIGELQRAIASVVQPQLQPEQGFQDAIQEILAQFQLAVDQNFLIILILDQFEEFFFNWPSLKQRRAFWALFVGCLNLPFLNLILCLREDYLHHVLECERLFELSQLEIVNYDLLSREVRYYLGDFSVVDAKAVIQVLTQRSQFYLDDDLIDALVQDLSGELNQIRPIELQVVGSELQRENITTLEMYRALGESPKETLVERFLHRAIEDCGPENAAIAKQVLYFLTEKKGIRPLKTRRELEAELALIQLEPTAEELDLVLEILVESGLVFEIPAAPGDRYQLLHDYLIDYIRQPQFLEGT